jgi:nucleoside phosphorylase
MGRGYSKRKEPPIAITTARPQQQPDRPRHSSQDLHSLCAPSAASSALLTNPSDPRSTSSSSRETSRTSVSGSSRHSDRHVGRSGKVVSSERAIAGSSKDAPAKSLRRSAEGSRTPTRDDSTLKPKGKRDSEVRTPDGQTQEHGRRVKRRQEPGAVVAGETLQERDRIGTSISHKDDKSRSRQAQEPKAARFFAKDVYTVGWICALPGEMAASEAILDEIHGGLQDPDPQDNNTYTLGQMQGHKIVIASLPAGNYGTNPAATVARDMLRTFKSIRIGLLVGIGGGVPSKAHDIRLGDVVVSQPTAASGGVIQFDRGKTISRDQFQRTGVLPPPPQLLLTALNKLQATHKREDSQILKFLTSMIKKYPKMMGTYTYQGAAKDHLCGAAYDHPNRKPCQFCYNSLHEVFRKPRESESPTIHYGNIASSNQVMRHGATRDRLGKELNALCFETEAAGLVFHFPCLVIRGICDYSDSHKNKLWQDYAAATAAAFAKELLLVIPAHQVRQESPIKVLGESI